MSKCPHVRWIVRDVDPVGFVRCTDCDTMVDILIVLTDLRLRVQDCIRMVEARLARRSPIVAPELRVVGGRAIDEEAS